MSQQLFYKTRLTIHQLSLESLKNQPRNNNIKNIKRTSLGFLQSHSQQKIRQKSKAQNEEEKPQKISVSKYQDQFLNNLLNLPEIKQRTRISTDTKQRQKELHISNKHNQINRHFDRNISQKYLQRIQQNKQILPNFSQKILTINNLKLQNINPPPLFQHKSKDLYEDFKGLHFLVKSKMNLKNKKDLEMPLELLTYRVEQTSEDKQDKNQIRFNFDKQLELNKLRKIERKSLQQMEEKIEGWANQNDFGYF